MLVTWQLSDCIHVILYMKQILYHSEHDHRNTVSRCCGSLQLHVETDRVMRPKHMNAHIHTYTRTHTHIIHTHTHTHTHNTHTHTHTHTHTRAHAHTHERMTTVSTVTICCRLYRGSPPCKICWWTQLLSFKRSWWEKLIKLNVVTLCTSWKIYNSCLCKIALLNDKYIARCS
jgi:hypothetical protein